MDAAGTAKKAGHARSVGATIDFGHSPAFFILLVQNTLLGGSPMWHITRCGTVSQYVSGVWGCLLAPLRFQEILRENKEEHQHGVVFHRETVDSQSGYRMAVLSQIPEQIGLALSGRRCAIVWWAIRCHRVARHPESHLSGRSIRCTACTDCWECAGKMKC